MNWFRRKAQPKDERPPLEGYGEQLEGYSGVFPVRYRSPVVPPSDPPQGGSVIAHSQEESIFPLGRSGVQPYLPPAPRVDPRLIGEDWR